VCIRDTIAIRLFGGVAEGDYHGLEICKGRREVSKIALTMPEE
jgi:hypothetical protein